MGDTGISTDSVTQEISRRKRKEHTVNSIDTGATRTIASKLASEDSTQEEAFRTRFSAMKGDTKLEIEDATGAKATVTFNSFTAENGGARGYITTTAVGANQSQELSVSSAVKITSYNRVVSEDEGGNIELGGQSLKFAAGKELKFDDDGTLELPSNSSIRFGDSGSTKVIAMDGSGNLDLAVGTDIRFGGDAAKSIKFDGSGNLEVPDTAEIRFGSGGTKKIKFDGSNNLELPASSEIKIGTKRMKIGTNGELEVANDGTNFTEVGGGFQSQVNSAPVGSSIIKGAGTSGTVHKPSPTILFRFTAVGSSSYTVNGPGLPSGGAADATLVLYRGFTYDFHNQAGGAHPLAIRTSSGGSTYTTGVSGSNTGIQTFTVPMDAPNTLYYQCTIHSGMIGTLDIR
tara:strand:- start:43 stop:1245 length:1203 start_codon:yes stop_codon:yes gene_type:complete